MNDTVPPSSGETRGLEDFEASISALGEPQARLKNLIEEVKKGKEDE